MGGAAVAVLAPAGDASGPFFLGVRGGSATLLALCGFVTGASRFVHPAGALRCSLRRRASALRLGAAAAVHQSQPSPLASGNKAFAARAFLKIAPVRLAP